MNEQTRALKIAKDLGLNYESHKIQIDDVANYIYRIKYLKQLIAFHGSIHPITLSNAQLNIKRQREKIKEDPLFYSYIVKVIDPVYMPAFL